MSIYAKEFFSIYFAFVEFGHLMWGSTFPVIVFTDNRSVTRFFHAKLIPPALWNACDYVLQNNFVIAHVAGSMNTAADFLSSTEVNPVEKLELTIQNDIHTEAIEVNIQSSGIVEEEQIYILPDDELDENQLWQEKQNIRDQAQNETHNEPENNKTELQQIHKPTSSLNTCSEGHFRDNAKIRLAIDVFSRDLFAYPVTRITASAVARVIMDILCKHTCLPTTIITDLGTQFNAQVTHEVAAVLGIDLKHATMKHAQTIGILERTHAS